MKKFVVPALLMLTVCKLEAKEVQCERMGNFNYHLVGSVNSCFMLTMTTIDTPGFTISSAKNETVEGLRLAENRKIRFLPEKVSEKFPNLLAYYAYSCSLTEVFKINFEKLVKLKILLLDSNQIVKIPSDTFEDLKSLEYVQLRKKLFRFC